MGHGLILETTFLIDLERELARGASGPAQSFLAAHAAEPLYTTVTIAGELAAGVEPMERPAWEQLLAPLDVLPCTSAVAWTYGQTFRFLRANGLLISTNDLWIAATAVTFGKGVVTANERDYARVPGLRVVPYRSRPAARRK